MEGQTISVNTGLIFIPFHPTYHFNWGRVWVLLAIIVSIGGSVYFDSSYKGINPISVQYHPGICDAAQFAQGTGSIYVISTPQGGKYVF